MTKEEKRQRHMERRKKAAELLGTYLDDLLTVAACVCFTAAAWLRFGASAALGTAGLCLAACAVSVARAKRGGRR